jgi:uncharacterized protein (DUF302 family)
MFVALSLTGCAAHSDAPMSSANPQASAYGIVALKSHHPFAETLALLKADIAAKKLVFFDELDQKKLGGDAGVNARPSTLLVFGNPGLGVQFITANPQAGIDWPVRLLVYQDQAGQVWVEYTDFAYIAQRHSITSRDPQFKMASEVISSIAGTVTQ